jgi:hypothetical protein
MPAGALICQESSGNTSGRRVAACAGTAECNYTPVRKPTPRSKRSSSLQPTTYILESMAVEVARTKCRRASTAIRTRVHGVSKNFGSGCEPEYLTIASHSAIKYWGAGRSTTEVSFSISSLPRFANRVSGSAMAIESVTNANRKTRDALRGSPAAHPRVLHYLLEFVSKFVSSKVTGRKLLVKQAEDPGRSWINSNRGGSRKR